MLDEASIQVFDDCQERVNLAHYEYAFSIFLRVYRQALTHFMNIMCSTFLQL